MNIKITVNLGNYENVTLESGEHDTASECVRELKDTAPLFRVPHVKEYMTRVFGGV